MYSVNRMSRRNSRTMGGVLRIPRNMSAFYRLQRKDKVVCCLLSAVCCLLSAVCCLLSGVCCLRSEHCLLSAVCCLLPTFFGELFMV
jgi:hypothetical protein